MCFERDENGKFLNLFRLIGNETGNLKKIKKKNCAISNFGYKLHIEVCRQVVFSISFTRIFSRIFTTYFPRPYAPGKCPTYFRLINVEALKF